MKNWLFGSLLIATGLTFGSFAAESDFADPDSGLKYEISPAPPKELKNRVGLSYRVGFNVSATFRNLGGFAYQHDPGPLSGNVPHEYDTGYNLPDSTHNGMGLTWNWGFNDVNQVRGDNLVMTSSSGLADGTARADTAGEAQHGVELSYNRLLGTYKKLRYGFEGALNYVKLSIREGDTVRT